MIFQSRSAHAKPLSGLFRKGDRIILLVLLAAVVLTFAARSFFLIGAEKSVEIKVEDTVYYSVSLNDDRVIDLPGNRVIIEDGKVYVKSADCKNQVCVHHAAISHPGETIVCLPNRVVITVR